MGASRKPKQVEVKLNLFTKMIDLNNKAEQQVAADNIQKKPRRIVTMKSGNNQAMVQTVQKAVTHGIDALIITPRVDVAGNKYTRVGLRKGKTELQGKILLNSHIWNYLLAVLQGKELPEISEYSAESANCGQHEWLTEVEKEIRQHTRRYREEYVETKNGNGYLMRKYLFPNGKVIMPAEAMTDVTAIFE